MNRLHRNEKQRKMATVNLPTKQFKINLKSELKILALLSTQQQSISEKLRLFLSWITPLFQK